MDSKNIKRKLIALVAMLEVTVEQLRVLIELIEPTEEERNV